MYLGSYRLRPLNPDQPLLRAALKREGIPTKTSGHGGPPLWKAAIQTLFLSLTPIYVPEGDLVRAQKIEEQEGYHSHHSG